MERLWRPGIERLLNARVIARSVICGSEGLTVAPQGIAAMRSPMRILLAVLLALVCVPMWNGVPRLPLLGDRAVVHAERVALREGHPEWTRKRGRASRREGVGQDCEIAVVAGALIEKRTTQI